MDKLRDIIFTHSDLDGMSSYLTLCWILKSKPNVVTTTPTTINETLNIWLKSNKFEDYRTVYFLDLDTTNAADIIDVANVVIIDHHISNTHKYKNAKVAIKEYSSCSKLLKDLLGKDVKFTDPQKLLIALADDFDSHSKKTEVSYDLNVIFHNTNDKIASFVANFYKGFNGFDKFQKNLINIYKSNRDEHINSIENIYEGVLSIKEKKYKVLATFSNDYVQDVCDHLLTKYPCDIVFLVMPKRGKVCIRKQKDCDLDLSNLASKLCNGGGHKEAAGGVITEAFEMFSKTLKPVI